MGKFSRVLNGRPYKEKIPSRVIFIDTETKAVDRDETTQDLSLLLGCYETWIVDEIGLPIALESSGVFYTEHEFYTLIKRCSPCRVVAHNWRFDATVLRIGSRENLVKYGYNIDVNNSIIPVETKGFSPFLINLDFDGREAELICNTNFYKQSLASLAENFGTEKLEIPHTEDTELMIEYCARDVEVLRKAFFFLFEFTQEIGGVTPGTTIAMSANRVYRKAFRPNERIQGTLSIPYISDIEQEAYKGGRTDAFFTGSPSTTVYKYDVNSLYPFAMLGDIPIRYLQKAPINQLEHALDGHESRFLYLTDVTIKISEESPYSFIGGEGIRTDKRELIFPMGEYRVWVWEPMLRILHRHGFIKQIHTTYAYTKAPIFDDYVLTLYRLREQYKITGDKSRDLLVKILLNSLYGKFGQRNYSRWERATDFQVDIYSREAVGIERFTDLLEDEFVEFLQIADDLYYSYTDSNPSPSPNSVMSIAGYITTKARAILWDSMRTVIDLGGQIYYCDTDSIFSSIPLPEDMVDKTALGKWKLEETIDGKDTEFVAPKHYFVDGRWTIKGIRNPQGNGRHEQEIFPNFMTDLMSKNPTRRKRLESGAEITTIIKEPTGVNNKRVYGGENSPTYPIVLS